MIALDERVFEALGSPTRREIVKILASGPHAVGQIADCLPVSRPAVSKHLRVLEKADLVSYTKSENRNLFRLNPKGFESAKDWLEGFWDNALARFALVAENTAEENH